MEEMLRIWNLFVYAFKNAFNYKGRACRMEMVSLIAMYVLIIFVLASAQMGLSSLFLAFPRIGHFSLFIMKSFFFVTSLFAVAFFVMWISLSIRRLHDLNYSGWWVLPITVFQAVPILNIIASLVMIYFYFIKKGNIEENKYGEKSVNF